MGKKALIISTSIRNGSNSEILAHEAERGALSSGGVTGPNGAAGCEELMAAALEFGRRV